MSRKDEAVNLDIGDLVRWREPMGGPPFFIQGEDTFTMNSSYLGIIYDITYDGTSSILSYMVRWPTALYSQCSLMKLRWYLREAISNVR